MEGHFVFVTSMKQLRAGGLVIIGRVHATSAIKQPNSNLNKKEGTTIAIVVLQCSMSQTRFFSCRQLFVEAWNVNNLL